MGRVESPHATLFDPGRLMRKLRSIVSVLTGVMRCIRGNVAVGDAVAPRLICDDRMVEGVEHRFQEEGAKAKVTERLLQFVNELGWLD